MSFVKALPQKPRPQKKKNLKKKKKKKKTGVPPPGRQAPRLQRPGLHAQLRGRAFEARRGRRGRARGGSIRRERTGRQRRRRRRRRQQRSRRQRRSSSFLLLSDDRQGPRGPGGADARRRHHDGLGRGRGEGVVRLLQPEPGGQLRLRRELHLGGRRRCEEEEGVTVFFSLLAQLRWYCFLSVFLFSILNCFCNTRRKKSARRFWSLERDGKVGESRRSTKTNGKKKLAPTSLLKNEKEDALSSISFSFSSSFSVALSRTSAGSSSCAF